MCIIPFWLVDWETAGWPLGDCWLAPRRLLAGPWETAGPWEGWMAPGKAATAGCTRRLLAGVCAVLALCWFS